MYPDHVALITVTRLARGIGDSALPNAPVIDDFEDYPSWLERLTAARMRLAHLMGRRKQDDAATMRPTSASC
jgi:hypothetical protein